MRDIYHNQTSEDMINMRFWYNWLLIDQHCQSIKYMNLVQTCENMSVWHILLWIHQRCQQYVFLNQTFEDMITISVEYILLSNDQRYHLIRYINFKLKPLNIWSPWCWLTPFHSKRLFDQQISNIWHYETWEGYLWGPCQPIVDQIWQNTSIARHWEWNWSKFSIFEK